MMTLEVAKTMKRNPSHGSQRTLIVMRHAKSAWDDPSQADHDRPLNDRGRRDAARMARHAVESGWLPDLILASTAERVSETLAIVRGYLPTAPDQVVTRRLYLATVGEILDVVREQGGDYSTVWVVGHNPGLQELVENWLGPLPKFPTAAMARFVFPIADWTAFSTDLEPLEKSLVKPRDFE